MRAKNEQMEPEGAGLRGNRAYERFRNGVKETLREDLLSSRRRPHSPRPRPQRRRPQRPRQGDHAHWPRPRTAGHAHIRAEKKTDTLTSANAVSSSSKLFFEFIQCSGTVGSGFFAPPGAAGALTSTGTSLLDYGGDMPVAPPHGGFDLK
jgi:hypothetical protein